MPENEKGKLLVFQEKKYDLTKLLAVVGDAPHVEIKYGDINMEPGPDTSVVLSNLDTTDAPKVVTFFKWEGKFVILTGHAQAIAQLPEPKKITNDCLIKGRLLSTPALKKARIVEYVGPPPTPNPIPAQPDFGNRPRWKTNSNSAHRSPYRDRK